MNRLLPLAACALSTLAACGGSDKKEPPTPPATLDLATFQAAELAIGQPDLATNDLPACDPGTVTAPYGAAAFDGTTLFVSDTIGNRVLGFAGVPAASGATPYLTLGQADCAPPGDPLTAADELAWPQAIRVAGGKLVVTDNQNNRVVIWNGVPTADGAPASVAVGKPDLTSWEAETCDGATLWGPWSATVAGGKLIVADTNHHRVLVWNALPAASGAAADLVLGQRDAVDPVDPFSNCTPNDSDGDGVPDLPTLATMANPTDVWSDGTRLVVADQQNHRVLVWNTFPTTSGQAADFAIDRVDPMGSAVGAAGLNGPSAVASDGVQLFVADAFNHRVLVFPSFPDPVDGPPAATVVIGQADLDGISSNAGGAVGANSLDSPSGLAILDDALVVADTGNHRVLVFRPPAP